MRNFNLILVLFLFFILDLQAQRPDQLPAGSPDSLDAFYTQEGWPGKTPRKILLPALKDFYADTIVLDTIGFTPPATGNTQYLTSFVIDPNGDKFYISSAGASIKLTEAEISSFWFGVPGGISSDSLVGINADTIDHRLQIRGDTLTLLPGAGTIAAGSDTIFGVGTSWQYPNLNVGQILRVGDQDLKIERIVSDTEIIFYETHTTGATSVNVYTNSTNYLRIESEGGYPILVVNDAGISIGRESLGSFVFDLKGVSRFEGATLVQGNFSVFQEVGCSYLNPSFQTVLRINNDGIGIGKAVLAHSLEVSDGLDVGETGDGLVLIEAMESDTFAFVYPDTDGILRLGGAALLGDSLSSEIPTIYTADGSLPVGGTSITWDDTRPLTFSEDGGNMLVRLLSDVNYNGTFALPVQDNGVGGLFIDNVDAGYQAYFGISDADVLEFQTDADAGIFFRTQAGTIDFSIGGGSPTGRFAMNSNGGLFAHQYGSGSHLSDTLTYYLGINNDVSNGAVRQITKSDMSGDLVVNGNLIDTLEAYGISGGGSSFFEDLTPGIGTDSLVSIGSTTAPGGALDVFRVTGNDNIIRAFNAAGDSVLVASTSSGDGLFNMYDNANNNTIRLHSDGSSFLMNSVGIGTKTPGAFLGVFSNDADIAHFENTNERLRVYADGTGAGIFTSDLTGFYINESQASFQFLDSGSGGKFNINTAGQFSMNTYGIGTHDITTAIASYGVFDSGGAFRERTIDYVIQDVEGEIGATLVPAIDDAYNNFGTNNSVIVIDEAEGQTGITPSDHGIGFELDHTTFTKYFQIYTQGEQTKPMLSVGQFGTSFGLNQESFGYVSITNPSDNNKRALYINQLATGAGSDGLRVYSHSLQEPAAYFRQWNGNPGNIRAETQLCHFESGIGSNWFFRNMASDSTAAPLVFIEQDNASDDQPALQIQQDGTGAMIESQNFDVFSTGKIQIRSSSLPPAVSSAGDFITLSNSIGQAGMTLVTADASTSQYIFGCTSDTDYARLEAFYNSGSPFMRFRVDGTEEMRLSSIGLGIGTTPSYPLHVNGTYRAIDGLVSGKLHVGGISTPTLSLQVTGEMDVTSGQETIANFQSTNTFPTFRIDATGAQAGRHGVVSFRDQGVQVGVIAVDIDGGFMTFGNNSVNNDYLVISNTGSIGVGINAPDTHIHGYHATENTIAHFESGDAIADIKLSDNTTTADVILQRLGNNAFLMPQGGKLGAGGVGSPGATIHVQADATTNPALIVAGVSSQTSEIFQVVNSSTDTLFAVEADGEIIIKERTIRKNPGGTITSSTYEVENTDFFLPFDCDSNAITADLPDAGNYTDGTVCFRFMTLNNGANDLLFTSEGGNINGGSTYTAGTDERGEVVAIDGNWYIF